VEWRLVDEVVPPSAWEQRVKQRALALAAGSDRADASGIALTPLEREFAEDGVRYRHVCLTFERAQRRAVITLHGPRDLPSDLAGIHARGADFWPLALARELDDAVLHLRLNEPALGLIVFRSEGDPDLVMQADALLEAHKSDWLMREIRLLFKRVLKRIDMTSRSLITLIEPGSCFAGTLAELAWTSDRAVMFSGTREGDNCEAAALRLSALNFGAYPMANGLTRLATRFLGEPDLMAAAKDLVGAELDAEAAEEAGLVTAAWDEVDWNDDARLMLEERASFSPDALTGMEANLRFAGPETMETRIFGRLTAWQNWIFQRPGAAGETGALKRYGSGLRPEFDPERV
jgi:benzoyl-CoA-dihydrodiol lyase